MPTVARTVQQLIVGDHDQRVHGAPQRIDCLPRLPCTHTSEPVLEHFPGDLACTHPLECQMLASSEEEQAPHKAAVCRHHGHHETLQMLIMPIALCASQSSCQAMQGRAPGWSAGGPQS